jgi:hypothetical protein
MLGFSTLQSITLQGTLSLPLFEPLSPRNGGDILHQLKAFRMIPSDDTKHV